MKYIVRSPKRKYKEEKCDRIQELERAINLVSKVWCCKFNDHQYEKKKEKRRRTGDFLGQMQTADISTGRKTQVQRNRVLSIR